jgi:hypothetical protein
VTLPLGKGKVELEVAPGSFTRENTFRVQLDEQRPLPPLVQLTLTMEEMDMGVTRLEAQPARRGVYLARGAFPMGGTWRIALLAGGMRGHALPSLGR